MKKALVLGASGAMGYAIVNELVERGLHVCAFARNKEHLEQLFGNNKQIEIFAGDVLQWEELYQAATDCELIFHSINLPYQ